MRSILLILFVATSFPIYAKDAVTSLLHKVQKKPVEMSFTLEIYWSVREKTDKKKGSLLLDGEENFDIELGKSRWVSDGVTVWQYSEKNNQLVIRNFLDMDLSLHPSSMFERFGKRTFSPVSEGKEKVYRWTSSEDLEYSKIDVVLSADNQKFERIIFVDLDENTTTYNFSSMKFLTSVEEDRFTFSAPEGVEIFDER